MVQILGTTAHYFAMLITDYRARAEAMEIGMILFEFISERRYMDQTHLPVKGLGGFQMTVYKGQTDSVFKTDSVFRDEYKRYFGNIQLPKIQIDKIDKWGQGGDKLESKIKGIT
jgi:hypothetical protein